MADKPDWAAPANEIAAIVDRLSDTLRSHGAGAPASPILPVNHPAPLGLVQDAALLEVSSALYEDGYYAAAVLEGAKLLVNVVKEVSLVGDLDGAPLMNTVFSPGKPILAVNALKTQSDRDEQQGYMQLMAGLVVGVRNPRAHRHGYKDDPTTAAELLAAIDHLLRVVRGSTLVGTRKAKQ